MTELSYLEQRRQLKCGISPGKGLSAPASGAKTSYHPKSEPIPAKPQKAGNGLKKGSKQRIRKVTKKRAKQNQTYTKVKKKFLQENPTCQANLEGCTHIATDLHHIGGRTGENLVKIEDFAALCRNCHDIIHKKMSAERAKKLGLKK